LDKRRESVETVLAERLSQVDGQTHSAEVQALVKRKAQVDAALAQLDARGKSAPTAKTTGDGAAGKRKEAKRWFVCAGLQRPGNG